MDAFASALGFFLIGFDGISGYKSPQCVDPRFFNISDPVLWFFKVSTLSDQIIFYPLFLTAVHVC